MFCIRAIELDGKKDRTYRFVACEESHLENTDNFKLRDRKTGLQKKDFWKQRWWKSWIIH